MTFDMTLGFALLAIVPVLLIGYFAQKRRRRRAAVRFSNVALVKAATIRRSNWRRHIPAALLLTGLASLGVAAAQPQAQVAVSTARTPIILALDVSGSMCATDVLPNRLAVAQDAAREFIRSQPQGTRIGIVAFSGSAQVVASPTTDRELLTTVVDTLTTNRGTVIGSAILKSIDAIAEMNPNVSRVDPSVEAAVVEVFADQPGGVPEPSDSKTPTDAPAANATYVPDIVVVLTVGANTRGIDPVVAAAQAAQRGVRVYTIGFGTTQPTTMVCTASQIGGRALDGGGMFGGGRRNGGGFRGGGGRFLVADEPSLQAVAATTGAKYYKAEDADQLNAVFNSLPKDVVRQQRPVEISAGFVGLGAFLTAAAFLATLRLNRT